MSTNLKNSLILLILIFTVVNGMTQVQFSRQNNTFKREHTTRSAIPGGVIDMNGDLIDDLIILDEGKRIKIGISNGPGEAMTFFYGPVLNTNEEWTLTAGDLNNDGMPEIITSGVSGIVNITSFNGSHFNVVKTGGGFYAQGSNVVDINNDGYPDYFVCDDDGPSKIFLNDGTGKLILTPVIDFSTIPASDGSGNYGSEWIDVNNDLFPDLFIAKCRAGVNDPADPRRINVLYINNGDGTFTERAAEYKVNSGEQSWVVTFGDIDNDGDLDAFEANHYGPHRVLENIEGKYFEPVDFLPEPLSSFAFQAVMRDLDNDGFLDIVVAGVEGLYFLYNNGDKTFRKTSVPPTWRSISSVTLGDINDDGFIDIHAHHSIPINVVGLVDDDILINKGNENHYVKFNLEGITSNRSAIGSRIEIFGEWGKQTRYVKGGESYGIFNSLQQHFGLAVATSVDSIIVNWPSGHIQKHLNLEVNASYLIREDGCITKVLNLYPEPLNYYNEAVTIHAPAEYSSYAWSDGTTDASKVVATEGIYRVTMTDQNGCQTIVKPIKVVSKCFTSNTDILPYPENYEVCGNSSIVLEAVDAASHLWNTGDTNAFISVSQSGWYYLEATDFCGNSVKDSVEVIFRSFEYTLRGDTIRKSETATLVSDNENTSWYDSEEAEIPLYTGAIFETDPLQTYTVFYAVLKFLLSSKDGNVGVVSFPTVNEYSANAVAGNMIFDVHTDCILKAVTVKTDLPGSRNIIIRDNVGAVQYSKVFHLQTGINRLQLEAPLKAGENYSLETDQQYNQQQFGFRSPRLVRTFQNTSYPYRLENAVSLLTSSTGPSYYYYFYDWEVTYDISYCSSAPIAVPVIVDSSSSSQDLFPENNFVLFPNPATNHINIKGIRDFLNTKISVTDISGKMYLHNVQLPVSASLNINPLPSGIYLIRIQSENNVSYHKIIKL